MIILVVVGQNDITEDDSAFLPFSAHPDFLVQFWEEVIS
jgi:hypothetical protein